MVNTKNELLILKGSPNDPQFKKSLWYVITGGCEKFDDSIEGTVIREIKEETDLDVIETFYLNWIFKYKSLGSDCVEYAYISFVNDAQVRLNEESIEYRWCTVDEFIKMIDWYGDKAVLRQVLEKAMKKEKLWNCEKVEAIINEVL